MEIMQSHLRKTLVAGLLALASLGTACTHFGGEKDNAVKDSHEGMPQPQVWFKGNVEEAFKKAEQEKKLVFLYWGAIWCPPCNELKAQVFTKPKFAEIMKNFIPVYLDGDTDVAQVWGEKFQASGYPTVLVFDSSKKEIYRLNAVVTIDEFAETMQALLASSNTFERSATAVSESRATRRDLQLLAYSDWSQLPEDQFPVSRRINLLDQAFSSTDNSVEKAVFGSNWLTQVVDAKEHLSDKQLDKIWAAIFEDGDTIWAAREFIKYGVGDTFAWLGWKPDEQRYIYLKQQWLKAASQIEVNPAASVGTRLLSVNPEIDFFKYEHPKDKAPQSLRKKVELAARHADEDSKSEYERHAVISDAAYLLRQVDSFDLARKMLEDELKKTNTPWYYQSSLSALEGDLGHTEAARKWSAEARKSVKGRASKVQWITSDLLLNAKDGKNSIYVSEITQDFYSEALGLRDGFSGRNWTRAKKVQEALMPYKADPAFQKTFAKYAPLCEKQVGDSKSHCQEHFAALR